MSGSLWRCSPALQRTTEEMRLAKEVEAISHLKISQFFFKKNCLTFKNRVYVSIHMSLSAHGG